MNTTHRTQAPADANGAARTPPVQACRARVRHSSLSDEQVEHLRSIAAVYIPDMANRADPAAAEVLLVLLEVCRILRLSPARLTRVFGERTLRALDAWGEVIPAR